jgi:hypothetical protein
MKNAISAKHLKINAKELKREQLKYVSGCGVPITMLMCLLVEEKLKFNLFSKL